MVFAILSANCKYLGPWFLGWVPWALFSLSKGSKHSNFYVIKANDLPVGNDDGFCDPFCKL